MGLKSYDLKKLWARSGNLCSFPGCGEELVPERRANRVVGEEAHINGEKPTAPRFDPQQSQEERESYENRILMCPTHHTVIDADAATWTVEKLLQMKKDHEAQITRNRQHPQLVAELEALLQRYNSPKDASDITVPEIIDDTAAVHIVRVDASREGGINTNIRVRPGNIIGLFARGLISYDAGYHFASPEGIICDEYGLPLLKADEQGLASPFVLPHPEAYKTDKTELGRVGSLIGWIDTYSEEKSFLVGSKKELVVAEEGYLFLAVNDARGTYGDNDGEYRVDIRVLE